MLRMLAALCVLKATASAAAEPPALPKSPPPEFHVVHSVDREAGEVTVLYARLVPVHRQGVRAVERNGVKEEVPYTFVDMIQEQRTRIIKLANIIAENSAGQEVTAPELSKKLEPGLMFAWFDDPKPIDAAYRRMLADDVLIVQPAK